MNETGKPFRTVKVGQKEMSNVVLELNSHGYGELGVTHLI